MNRAAFVLLAACSAGDEVGAQRSDALRAAADSLMADYATFVTSSEAMATSVEAFCDGSGSLEDASAAWWDARAPWKRAEIAQFGPVVEYPERLGPQIDGWPANADAIDALVDGDAALDDFSKLAGATRGLPVVEYLLWGDDHTGRRCEALVGASRDVAANAVLLHNVWRRDWYQRITLPRTHPTPYATNQDVLDEWVNRMAFTAENIRGTKLGKPAGDAAQGNLSLDLMESRPSGRALTDARDALAGVASTWQAIAPLVDDATIAGDMDRFLADADSRLAALPEPFEALLTEQPEVLPPVLDSLRGLQVIIQVELAPVLGVTITFNDNDGD